MKSKSKLISLYFPSQGNNACTIRALDKELRYITFNEALTCVKSPDLHPKLKSQYVELIIGQSAQYSQWMGGKACFIHHTSFSVSQ